MASFHEYLFKVRDELNAQQFKWPPERVEMELRRVSGSLHAHNAMVRHLVGGHEGASDSNKQIWSRFILSRGIAYLMNSRNLLYVKKAVMPRLREQLVDLELSSLKTVSNRWQYLCLRQWCALQERRNTSSRCNKNKMIGLESNFLSNKLTFITCKKKGRGVICHDRVDIGETLIVESPLASVTFNPSGAHNCSHCAQVLHLPVPCSSCSDVLFCSMECHEEAQASYHQTECEMRLFGILHRLAKGQQSVSCGKAIALRLITMKSLQFFLKSKFKDSNYGLLPDDFPDDSYGFLWHLYALKSPPENNMTTINSFFHLLKSTSWASPTLSEHDESVVLNVMRRYVRMIEANSFAIDEPKPSTRVRLSQGKMVLPVGKQQIGSALYLRSSMINHACNPNACFVFRGNKIVIAATSRIEPGQELTVSYGFTYPYQGKKSRLLKSLRYDFVCSCPACEENWPGWSAIPTGLVPEKIFDPRKWKNDDILLNQDLKDGAHGMPEPNRFLDDLRSLQSRERKAKEDLDFVEFFRVHSDRSRVLSPIKQPHFCHHKTRMGVVTALWYKHWFGLY